MTTYFHEALSRKIDVKVGGKIRRMSVREGIAMNATNLALKGDVNILPLVLAIEREVRIILDRKNIQAITEDMTPQQAMDAYMRTIRGDD